MLPLRISQNLPKGQKNISTGKDLIKIKFIENDIIEINRDYDE